MTEDSKSTRGQDFIRAMITDDMRTGKYGGRVVTRFPPEPNGFLHIGHAKSIVLNFGLAREFDGRCHLRFDDTNPETEDVQYVDSIQEDVRWLGFDWGDHLHFASDYFESMYLFAEHLIREGHAYVDSSTDEEIREARGTVTQPGRPTRFRDRSADESLDLFRRMRAGEFPNGAHVLRARIDLASPNMLMRDPVLYRIRHAHHYRTGDDWCIYPLYDYAHCIEDAIENVTHSLCTLEFDNNRELYDWVVAHVPRGVGSPPVPPDSHPEQTEFARLALDYTVMSKRKLLQLVREGHVDGWDDPRMPTIAGLRRRGLTPESIRSFCDTIGVAKTNSRVDIGKLEHAVRDDLNHRAPRVLCVLHPLRVEITNWPAGRVEEIEASYWPHDVPREGTRTVPFSGTLYIDRDDFREDPPKGFHRLVPGGEVRLRHGYVIRCDDVVRDDRGEISVLRCSYDPETRGGNVEGRTVKGTIQWVSAEHAVAAEVRLYDRLFSVPDPEADPDVPFTAHLNPSSLETIERALIEPSVVQGGEFPAEPGAHFQFERLGYFVCDSVEPLVFNRTVTLRDTWSRQMSGAPSAGRPVREKPKKAEPARSDTARGSAEGRRPPERTPELESKRQRYVREHGIAEEEADVLTRDAAVSALYDDAVRASSAEPAAVARWLVNEVPREAREELAGTKLTGAAVGELVDLLARDELSSSAAREVLAHLLAHGGAVGRVVDELGLRQMSDARELEGVVDAVLRENEAKVKEYRDGKTGLLGFFIGQVMARTGGRANPGVVREIVQRELGS